MAISRGGKLKVKVARTNRGNCGKCHQPIWPGEKYVDCVNGTNMHAGYTAHYDCYKGV